MWKGREKRQKFEYLKNKKSFLDEIKKKFSDFKELPFGEKTRENTPCVTLI